MSKLPEKMKNVHDVLKKGQKVLDEIESSSAPSGYVAMPKELTAENGAKGLLIGEFNVEISIQCPECDGYGYHMHPPDNKKEECELCKGESTVIEKHLISWTTIKEIYAMAVKHLAT